MKKLTPKQEKFANLYVELGSASDAYRKAYDVSENTKDSSINEQASKLLSDLKITSRVQEIREETAKAHGVDRAKIIEMLFEVINDADYTFKLGKDSKLSKEDTKAFYRVMQQTKNTDKLRAIEILNKMLGLNEPEKVHTKQTIEIIEKSRD